MPCNQCGRDRLTIPVKVTDLSMLNQHVMVGGRGGRDRTYIIDVCGECVVNLAGVPGGDSVRVEPELLAIADAPEDVLG